MKKCLGPEEKDWIIKSKPVERFKDDFKKYDVVLLGPQIRFKKEELQKEAKPYNIPVECISPVDYGLAKGKEILEFAKKLYKDNKGDTDEQQQQK
jgi:PTS system cellobiose-specific IIB component